MRYGLLSKSLQRPNATLMRYAYGFDITGIGNDIQKGALVVNQGISKGQQYVDQAQQTVQTVKNVASTVTGGNTNTSTGTDTSPGSDGSDSASASGISSGMKIALGAGLLAGGLYMWKRRK